MSCFALSCLVKLHQALHNSPSFSSVETNLLDGTCHCWVILEKEHVKELQKALWGCIVEVISIHHLMPCVGRQSPGQRCVRLNEEGLRLVLQMQALEWLSSDVSQPFVAYSWLEGCHKKILDIPKKWEMLQGHKKGLCKELGWAVGSQSRRQPWQKGVLCRMGPPRGLKGLLLGNNPWTPFWPMSSWMSFCHMICFFCPWPDACGKNSNTILSRVRCNRKIHL